jgi:hypothetical protein
MACTNAVIDIFHFNGTVDHPGRLFPQLRCNRPPVPSLFSTSNPICRHDHLTQYILEFVTQEPISRQDEVFGPARMGDRI